MKTSYLVSPPLLLTFIIGSAQLPVSVQIPGQLSAARQVDPNRSAPTDEEYEIWSLAIKEVLKQTGPSEAILIENETMLAKEIYNLQILLDPSAGEHAQSKRVEEWRALRSEVLADTIASFKQENQVTDVLSSKFSLSIPAVLIAHKEITEFRAKSPGRFWGTLHRRYPEAIGLFSVSRIGFDYKRTQAFVYVAYRSGEGGGEGRYVLLQQKNGVWIRTKSAVAWMS